MPKIVINIISMVKKKVKPPSKKKEAVKLRLMVSRPIDQGQPDEGDDYMALIMTDTQKATCTITPLNSKGNPAPVDGVPQWSSSDPAVATVTPSTDGLSAVVTAVGVGTTQVNCVADADMDVDEIRELTALLDVEIKASEAVQMGISTGTPEEQ